MFTQQKINSLFVLVRLDSFNWAMDLHVVFAAMTA